MKPVNILIIGSGGREHALGWAVSKSPGCGKLYFAPGNAGTVELGENVSIPVTDAEALADFAASHAGFTVVGPEAALDAGVVDLFRARGLKVFGPDKSAARLETSKAYAKSFMKKYNIPTAGYEEFSNREDALAALDNRKYPLWVKADGLAAGKGAVYCADKASAVETVQSVMSGEAFGAAGNTIVLEEHMEGRELTLICLTDGKTIVSLESARDHKRVNDGDEGLNTGGMGCISPVPGYENGSADFIAEMTLEGIKAEELDYRGVIYIELMLTKEGPKVIEYNARFGDPEAQTLLPRLESDFLAVLSAVEERRLEEEAVLKWKPQTSICVVAASGGYPAAYKTGERIAITQRGMEDAFIFHAGTKTIDGALCTDGGRVLAVTGLGDGVCDARRRAYLAMDYIHFKGKHFRKDIGL